MKFAIEAGNSLVRYLGREPAEEFITFTDTSTEITQTKSKKDWNYFLSNISQNELNGWRGDVDFKMNDLKLIYSERIEGNNIAYE